MSNMAPLSHLKYCSCWQLIVVNTHFSLWISNSKVEIQRSFSLFRAEHPCAPLSVLPHSKSIAQPPTSLLGLQLCYFNRRVDKTQSEQLTGYSNLVYLSINSFRCTETGWSQCQRQLITCFRHFSHWVCLSCFNLPMLLVWGMCCKVQHYSDIHVNFTHNSNRKQQFNT